MTTAAGLFERLWSRVRLDPYGCWVWTGAKNRRGYGHIWISGRWRYVHRLSYRMWCGAIPIGLEIDHLCLNPACVNPAHLCVVTHAENRRRGRYQICRRGHPYDLMNTYTYIGANGRILRRCRACFRIVNQRSRQKNREIKETIR